MGPLRTDRVVRRGEGGMKKKKKRAVRRQVYRGR